LTIGTVSGVHGVHGELKLRLATDEPGHLRRIKRVWVGDEPAPRRLQAVRLHAGQALIRVSGIATPEAGRELVGQPVRIAGSEARPLAPGEYFLYQLIGLDAFDEAGNLLGRVIDLIETGANDVFVITPPGGGPDILLPHQADVVLDIQPAAGRMTVRPLVYEGEG
jgi:16S rRNA processing protein RimM